ncbi:cytochrome P450, partial [Amniculicola lignicola CBS 123094]
LALVTLGFFWVVWYITKFIAVPYFNPNDPPQLPYYLPFVGHFWSMFSAQGQLFMKGRNHFGAKPWAITTMGRSFYVIGAPDDILAVYKQPKALDFNVIIREIMRNYGLDEAGVDSVFDTGHGGKNWIDRTIGHFKQQLYPGEKHEEIQDRLLGHINEALAWNKIDGPSIVEQGESEKVVSLWDWAHEVIVDAQTRAFFGQSLSEGCPNIVGHLQAYEEEGWKLPHCFPSFYTRKMNRAKEGIVEGLTRYIRLPNEKKEDASWLIKTMCKGLDDMGFDDVQQANTFFSFYRTANANAPRLSFWSLVYILFNKDLHTSIMEEIGPAFKSDGTIDQAYLFHSCPLLASTVEETLRLTVWPLGIRIVQEDKIIGEKLLRKGGVLLMPYWTMHFDSHVFGADANTFRATRFIENKELMKNKSYKPFGGASHYCPGRFVARTEVQLFVAVVLKKFAPSLADSRQKFPLMDESMPTGAIQGLVRGQSL